MLTQLSIKNFAIIDSLEINFNHGFNVITGDTGSGKSIILGALKLLLGNRIDHKSILNSSKKCIVEAVFDAREYNCENFFSNYEIELDLENTIIRREITINGKSRTFINDTPVKLEVLKKISLLLLDIHSQHQNLLLNKSYFQLHLIDSIAKASIKDHEELIQEHQANYMKLKTLKRELNEIVNSDKDSKNRYDYLKYLSEELHNARLVLGEKEILEQNIKISEAKEQMISTLNKVSFLIDKNHQFPSIHSQLSDLIKDLNNISKIDDKYTSYSKRISQVMIEMLDISKESELAQSSIENETHDVSQLRDRLDLINHLEKKHNVHTFDELIKKKEYFDLEILKLSSLDKTISDLNSKIAILSNKLIESANLISNNRKTVSIKIESFIESEIKKLGLRNGEFKISITKENDINETGVDHIDFLFSSNRGVELKEISKVASGGEVSRLMLVLKSVLIKTVNLPCLILDEIDSGVSGEIAGRFGSYLQDMSKQVQLIVVTHLPQVAAKATSHYNVKKIDVLETTKTIITKLNDKDRMNELAKMLSGEKVSPAAIENAKALISNS